jgi:hypothetical protein
LSNVCRFVFGYQSWIHLGIILASARLGRNDPKLDIRSRPDYYEARPANKNQSMSNEPSEQDSDYDGAWKEALRLHLQAFMRKYFPAEHAAIDWRCEPVWFAAG